MSAFSAINAPTDGMTERIENVTVQTKANVYFDGQCVSHTLCLPDGSRKSVGVILPSTLHFETGAAEVMQCVAGSCEYKVNGMEQWEPCGPGDRFSVPNRTEFSIRVEPGEMFHYICHFN
jgi:uncharacterized protein YaiE (UPF0345 family)